MNPHLNQERVELLRSRSKSASKERLSQWPREDKMLPVVELDVTWVRFSILNHRTTGERLKMCRDRNDPHLFDGDPMGTIAQQAQYELLRSHRGFDNLKTDLRERGQQEHSVVTAEGVLINGNRRTVALRDLFLLDNFQKARYVRCLILPEDATADEIRLLETELQVSERFEEEYSWINRGFLIRELLNENRNNFEAVAKLMRMTPKTVQDEFRKFCQIDQLVALSGGTYMHIDFEPNESAFEELAKHIANKSQEEAAGVRDAYFLGTLASCKYRDLRNLRRVDAAEYVEREIESLPVLQNVLSSVPKDDPATDEIDDLLGTAIGSNGDSGQVAKLLTIVAKKRRTETIVGGDGTSIQLESVLQQINTAVTRAAEEAGADAADEEKVKAPAKHLKDALTRVRWARRVLAESRALPGWDEDDYQAALEQLQTGIADLEEL
jgi:hypothetical protein